MSWQWYGPSCGPVNTGPPFGWLVMTVRPRYPGAVARTTFLSKWEGRSLAELFDYLRTAMPYDNPGSRSDQEMIDAVAHMLALSDVPAGEAELAPDVEALESIEIVAEEP